jgi:integrase
MGFKMSTKRAAIPSMCRHKATGQAVVRLNGRDFYLGRWGSAEAQAKYDGLIAKWMTGGRTLPEPGRVTEGRLIKEVISGYHTHAVATLPEVEVAKIRTALRLVRSMYGELEAAKFNAVSYAALRIKLVESGPCISTGRARLGVIKRMIAWGIAREMIPDKILNLIQAFEKAEPLRVGRDAVKPSKKIKPAPEEHIQAILPHISPTIRAMIELQRLTGMRPGEVWRITTGQIDRTVDTWIYRPTRHKTIDRGKDRIISLGPRAQELLKPWLKADPDKPLFSPIEATEAQYAKRRQERVTPMTPSQRARKRKRNPQRKPREMYDKNSYKQAIERGCLRAGVPVFKPNQVRHSYATQVRHQFGLEAAQVLLGHSKADVTQVYAEKNLALAVEIARKIG